VAAGLLMVATPAHAAQHDRQVERFAGRPGWSCTERVHAQPSIGGERGQQGPSAMLRWWCVQWTFLPAQGREIAPPRAVAQGRPGELPR
jgi:hypothetical protein